jgi:hypothetical protein
MSNQKQTPNNGPDSLDELDSTLRGAKFSLWATAREAFQRLVRKLTRGRRL